MKILRVTTTYKNCTDEFVERYLKRLYNEEVLPGSTGIIAEFTSQDPDGPTITTTMYELIETNHPEKGQRDE
jgi:hypothetical protein